MSRGKAVVLGVFTAWPILYLLIFLCTVFGILMSGGFPSGPGTKEPTILIVLFALHFLTILEMFALLGIYMYHLFTTDRVPQDKKALWAVALFLGNMIAMPIYWYFYIWREPLPKEP